MLSLIATALPGASALASSAAAASSTTACLAGSPSSRISRAIERGGSRASSRPPPPLILLASRPPLAVMGAHSAEGPRCAFATAPLIAAHSRFDSWEEFAHGLDGLETGEVPDASFVAGHDLELGLHR